MIAKYTPLVRSVAALEGTVVTKSFYARLYRRWQPMRMEEVLADAFFRETGVNFKHLNSRITYDWILEALDSDYIKILVKYVPIIREIAALEGSTNVTDSFNSLLVKKIAEEKEQATA